MTVIYELLMPGGVLGLCDTFNLVATFHVVLGSVMDIWHSEDLSQVSMRKPTRVI